MQKDDNSTIYEFNVNIIQLLFDKIYIIYILK